MTLSKPIFAVFIWTLFMTSCQENIQATVDAEVIAGV